MKDVRINEATFPLANGGVGKLAVFIYGGNGDPRAHLYCASSINVLYGTLLSPTYSFAQLNCPWVLTGQSPNMLIWDTTRAKVLHFFKELKCQR